VMDKMEQKQNVATAKRFIGHMGRMRLIQAPVIVQCAGFRNAPLPEGEGRRAGWTRANDIDRYREF